MNMQPGVPFPNNNYNAMRPQSSGNVQPNTFNYHPNMMNTPLNLQNNQVLPESITYQLMEMINSAIFQLQQQSQSPQFIMPSPSVQNPPVPQPSNVHTSLNDASIALTEDVEYLYQEFEKIQKQHAKQKEVNKSVEFIVREKYQTHKKEEREKKLKKEIAQKYQNPSNRQHSAAIKIQRWFRQELSKKKDKKITTLKREVDMLKYQVQRLQIDQKTTLQLVRLLFEQVQLLTREVRERDSSEDQ
ncbi:predicted protein [Naegleria gruberi]|uniref:Predicted protein n=1 Tax=Naegleria gruberi TaxID=5762 RepID=D2V1I5_NAEGR|nr:uncharacterized protein NAEGRDRAFT_62592 [Naegleria gruberi]EFC49169.1 predicted protein [Naegleria gruberi]|eukprot:XP_002681913.1 predicted protein [Naegleria gruberi strain NEG-M]